jgi:cystinosin
VVKHAPQIYINYKLKSTQGWSFSAVLLDLIGGVFSMIQLFLDASNINEVLSNPAKLALGIHSFVVNIIFFIQFYWYRGSSIEYSVIENDEITTEDNKVDDLMVQSKNDKQD